MFCRENCYSEAFLSVGDGENREERGVVGWFGGGGYLFLCTGEGLRRNVVLSETNLKKLSFAQT